MKESDRNHIWLTKCKIFTWPLTENICGSLDLQQSAYTPRENSTNGVHFPLWIGSTFLSLLASKNFSYFPTNLATHLKEDFKIFCPMFLNVLQFGVFSGHLVPHNI